MHHIPPYIRIDIWAVDHTQGVAGEPAHGAGVVVPVLGVVVVEFAVQAVAGIAEGGGYAHAVCNDVFVIPLKHDYNSPIYLGGT